MIMEDMEDMGMMMNCSNMSMGGMRMHFYFGLLPEGLLFTTWTITTAWDMFGSIIAIIALAIAYEGLKSLRELLMTQEQKIRQRNKKTQCTNVKTLNFDECSPLVSKEKQSPPWIVSVKMAAREYINIFHILQSFLHVVQVGLGYLLMLVAMSYNGYLFLAVVFGAGFGYFIFAVFRKKSSPTAKTFEEDNEHCST